MAIIPAAVTELADVHDSKSCEVTPHVGSTPTRGTPLMPKPKLPDIDFEWSPQLAYAVGLLTTDGNLSKNGRCITMRSSDVPLLKTFKECLNLKTRIANLKTMAGRQNHLIAYNSLKPNFTDGF